MTEQQAEQTDQQAEAKHLVVHLTDGLVIHWPAETTTFNAHDDGDLTIHRTAVDEDTCCVAVFARGQWAAVYDDTYLAS